MAQHESLVETLNRMVQQAKDDLVFEALLDMNEFMLGSAYGPYRQPKFMGFDMMLGKYGHGNTST